MPINDKVEETDSLSKMSDQRQQLVIAMLEQPTFRKAAASIGISETTAWRIRKTPEFVQEYCAARRDVVAHSIGRLQQGCNAAAVTLLKVMVDPNTPAATRVQAAIFILNFATKAFFFEDVEVRVRALAGCGKTPKNPLKHVTSELFWTSNGYARPRPSAI